MRPHYPAAQIIAWIDKSDKPLNLAWRIACTSQGRPNMIAAKDQEMILEVTKEYWATHVKDPAFRAIFTGEEIGHSIASYVEKRTVKIISTSLQTKAQTYPTGKKRLRSMGDAWVKSGGILNPLNVKCGLWGTQGQPNMVAARKLLKALLKDQIDSYYLLIVKIERAAGLSGVEELVPKVFMVDMLDAIDFLAFDAGPGQLMLKEKQFYEHTESTTPLASRTLREKIGLLIKIRKDGITRLIENRLDELDKLSEDEKRYDDRKDHKITQKELSFDKS